MRHGQQSWNLVGVLRGDRSLDGSASNPQVVVTQPRRAQGRILGPAQAPRSGRTKERASIIPMLPEIFVAGHQILRHQGPRRRGRDVIVSASDLTQSVSQPGRTR